MSSIDHNITSCPIFPPFPMCSGNGICDESNRKCICKDGWSSIGDFAPIDGLDCNINIIAIKVIYASMMIVALVLLFKALHCISTQMKQAKKGKKKTSPLKTLSDPVRYYPYMIVFNAICVFIQGIYRFHYPLAPLGYDFTTTFLSSILVVNYTSCVSTFNIIVVRFLYQYSKAMTGGASSKMRERTKMILKMTPGFKLSGILIAIIPFLCYAFPNHPFEVACVYHVTLCIWNESIAFLSAARGVNTMVDLLQEHLKMMQETSHASDNKFEQLLKKLVRAKQVFIAVHPGSVIGWLLFAFSPSFSRQSGYFLPYLTIIGSIVGFPALSLITNDSDKTKDITPNQVDHEMKDDKNERVKSGLSSNGQTSSQVNAVIVAQKQ